MVERLFVDTSAWFAYANRSDPDHDAVGDVLRAFQGRIVTSNFVFDETVTLCRTRLGHDVASRIGATLLGTSEIDVIRVTAEDETEAWALFLARPDKAYSFTDCTSFVLLPRLGLRRALTLDADFRQEGFEVVPPAA